MKKYLTIREGIERGIAAIDSGELKWARCAYNRGDAYCVIGAAAEMERRAGGIGALPNYYDDLLRYYVSHGFSDALMSTNDQANTWQQARDAIRKVLDNYRGHIDFSPARNAARKKR